jgi:hypothetical protein
MNQNEELGVVRQQLARPDVPNCGPAFGRMMTTRAAGACLLEVPVRFRSLSSETPMPSTDLALMLNDLGTSKAYRISALSTSA